MPNLKISVDWLKTLQRQIYSGFYFAMCMLQQALIWDITENVGVLLHVLSSISKSFMFLILFYNLTDTLFNVYVISKGVR